MANIIEKTNEKADMENSCDRLLITKIKEHKNATKNAFRFNNSFSFLVVFSAPIILHSSAFPVAISVDIIKIV